MFFLDLSLPASGEVQGWQVDVYTQKDPYSGVSVGEPSDSFEGDETVILYAEVTYNEMPIRNINVAYQVFGPLNPLHNFTLFMSSVTDDSGMAQESFRIPWFGENAETIAFGTWHIVARVENAFDFLTFKVGWTVEIASLNVTNPNFPRGSWQNVHLSLKNIALIPKDAILSIILYDSIMNVFNICYENVTINVGGGERNLVLQVPHSAAVGAAKLNASVHIPTGSLNSPEVSTNLRINLLGDLDSNDMVDMRDLGIAASAFGTKPGDPRWNPIADITGTIYLLADGKVNMKDVGVTATQFGNTVEPEH